MKIKRLAIILYLFTAILLASTAVFAQDKSAAFAHNLEYLIKNGAVYDYDTNKIITVITCETPTLVYDDYDEPKYTIGVFAYSLTSSYLFITVYDSNYNKIEHSNNCTLQYGEVINKRVSELDEVNIDIVNATIVIRWESANTIRNLLCASDKIRFIVKENDRAQKRFVMTINANDFMNEVLNISKKIHKNKTR